MNIRRRFGGKKPIICILTLNNGSVVEIPGKGQLTKEMTSPYTFTIVSAEITKNSTSIGQRAFSNCNNMTSVTIPNSVTSIGDYAFYNCRGLTSVTIPNNVTSINAYAFDDCRGLTSITIPNGVTSIKTCAFSGCNNMTSVTIPNTVKSIANGAFSYCSSLTSITSLATTAPRLSYTTFQNIKTGGTLTVPSGSTGYDVWMDTDDYYLGKYNWTKVEQ